MLVVPECEITDRIERLVELSISVKNWMHYRDMGMLCFRRGQYEQAEEWLTRSARSNFLPGKPKTLYFLAMNHYARGDEAVAREIFRQADEYRRQIRASFRDGDFGEKWPNWLLLESIRREAQSKLNSSAESKRSLDTAAP